MSVIQSPPAGIIPRRDHTPIYDELTEGRTIRLRVEELLERAAAAHPDLVPGPDQIAAERGRELRDQDGIELAQGQLLAAWLADPGIGTHLIESCSGPGGRRLTCPRTQATAPSNSGRPT